jgi:ABC-type transport system involved in multi-copper enzyme maturation permease subunit
MQDSLPSPVTAETSAETTARPPDSRSRFRLSDLHDASLMGANAVVSRELRVALRNERAFATLAIYVAILGAVVASQFPSEASVALTTSRNTGAAALGTNLFHWFGWSQALLIVLLLPALATGALSQERERRTLEPLLLTPLSPLQIVWGKGVGVLAFAALLLLATVPLTSLCFLLGGVSPGDVIGVYCCLLGLAACVTALGLGCSAKWENTTQATLMCYLLVPLAVAVLVVGSGPGMAAAGLNVFWRSLSGVAMWWKKPHRFVSGRLRSVWQLSLVFVLPVLFALEVGIVAAGWDWGIFWIVFALPYLLLVSQITMKWAADEIARHPEPRLPTPERVAGWKAEWARAVEPPPVVYLPTATGKYSYSPQVPVAPPTRLVPATYGVKAFLPDGRNPIFMRDMRSGLLGKWSYLFRYSYIIVILSEIVMLLWLLSPAMDLRNWVDSFASLASVHLLLLMAGGAVFGARALAPEREQQTLPQLLTTPLSPRDIIGGKIMTVAVHTFYIWVLAVPGALLLAMMQIVPLPSILSFLALELVFGAFAMSWGLFCSMRALTVRRALGWALGGVGALVMASSVVRTFGQSLQPNAPSLSIDVLSAWLPLSAMDNAIRYWSPSSVFGSGASLPVSSQALLWVGFSALFFLVATLFLLAKTAGDFRRYLQEI